MAVDFSTLLYLPNYDMWARTVTITPVASQPGAPAYQARGIYTTDPIDIAGLDGITLTSDQKTILDVRDAEFSVVPIQGDLIHIPAEGNIPAEGDFEVTDDDANGGGETTLTLRLWTASSAAVTTTTLESSLNPSDFGQQPTFTATVSASTVPDGVVCFKVDGAVRAYTPTSNGVAIWVPGTSMMIGDHTVEAQFSPGNPLTFSRSLATLIQTVQ